MTDEKPASMDLMQMFSSFKVPGLDVEGLMTSHRRNIDAIVSANHVAVEGMQAVTRRQAEILRQTMEEVTRATSQLMQGGGVEDRVAKQSEMAKLAFEKALSNMRELAELISKSNREAFEVINQRVAHSLEEVRALVDHGPDAASAPPQE